MFRRLLLLLSFFALPLFLYAGGKLKYYFNHPVDNSVSTGVNAIYLNGTVDDTLISYINRAKYTIDVAVYNTTSSATNVMNAINAAYARNVKVRWIFDSSYQVESELNALNPGIYKLGRPDNNSYIMHNKFMVVDANSTDPNDAIVWTGSSNWNSPQFGSDYNNIVIVQDQAVARAYRAHFNMMWGDTGITPNNALAKFGAAKTDLGNHTFYVDGNLVEVYFSPKDGTNSKIQSVINSANVDIYFGMFTFTDNSDASLLVSKKTSGLYVAGIQDQSSSTSSAASTLSSGLSSSFYKVYNSSNSYHNKFLIVDPSDRCSDPTVLTGSHNWSFTANTQNDENTLIIHDDTTANIYYQSFRRDFTNLGGSLTVQNGCTSSVTDHNNIENSVEIFPNPSTGSFSISFDLASPPNVRVELTNAIGQVVSVFNEEGKSGTHHVSQNVAVPGIYIVKFNIGTESFAKKILVN